MLWLKHVLLSETGRHIKPTSKIQGITSTVNDLASTRKRFAQAIHSARLGEVTGIQRSSSSKTDSKFLHTEAASRIALFDLADKLYPA